MRGIRFSTNQSTSGASAYPPSAAANSQPSRTSAGRAGAQRMKPANLAPEASARLRYQLIAELEQFCESASLTVWAHRTLPLKNQLSISDAQAVEAAFDAKLRLLDKASAACEAKEQRAAGTDGEPIRGDAAAEMVVVLSKPVRERDRQHLKFVTTQPCLICGRTPSDAHHIKFPEPRAMGRKVSDKFTVPVCRLHHRELHRHGKERSWWHRYGIEPLGVAAALWKKTHEVGIPASGAEELDGTQ